MLDSDLKLHSVFINSQGNKCFVYCVTKTKRYILSETGTFYTIKRASGHSVNYKEVEEGYTGRNFFNGFNTFLLPDPEDIHKYYAMKSNYLAAENKKEELKDNRVLLLLLY